MSIAGRYINRELLLMLLAITAVLLVVTVGGRFISYLQDAALGKYSAEGILRILGYRLPGFLQLLLPFAWLLAVLLTLGRLHAESELIVLLGGGVGPVRLIGWLCPGALTLALLVGWFSFEIAPDRDRALTDFIRAERANAEFRIMNPGIFHVFQQGRRVTYASAVDDSRETLRDVFLAEIAPGMPPVTVRAQTGGQQVDEATGARFLVLGNGHRYVGEPGRASYHVTSFGRLRQRLEEGTAAGVVDIEARATRELLEQQGAEALAELHFRLALPLILLIGTLSAVGVSRTKPRQGRFARVLPGITVYVAYYAAVVFCRDAVANGNIPGQIGLWPVHAVFLGLGLVLVWASIRPARG